MKSMKIRFLATCSWTQVIPTCDRRRDGQTNKHLDIS